MGAKEIYTQTMKFNFMKLGLGAATIAASAVILVIALAIGALFGGVGVSVSLMIWLGLYNVLRFFLMHYVGYMLKAGHIAIIMTAVTTGQIPENQFEVGKKMVIDRFATANVYLVVDSLVSKAVKQLQHMVDKAGNLFGAIPGMNFLTNVLGIFIGIFLGYIDECCIGYTFYKQDQGAFKSAADGVAIYAQNWKRLLKDAAKTTIMVVLLVIGLTLAVFLVIGGLFALLHWNRFIAFLLAAMIATVIKSAFIDSWILVKMMSSYMEVAPSTELSFDLYGKLCGLSEKFKELFNKGQAETI